MPRKENNHNCFDKLPIYKGLNSLKSLTPKFDTLYCIPGSGASLKYTTLISDSVYSGVR